MAGYVKIWTTIESDGWFLSLSCLARGLWIQLIIAAKAGAESGQVWGKSWEQLGQRWGLSRETCAKNLRKFADAGKITLEIENNGTILITIHNYLLWQGVKGPKEAVELHQKRRKPCEKSHGTCAPQNSSEQNRTEQNKKKSSGKPDKPPTDHKFIIEYFCQKHQDKCDGVKYHFAGGKDGKLVKSLLATYSRDELISLIDRFFQPTGDKFVDTAAKTIGVLNVVVNKLAQLGTDEFGGMNLSDRERRNITEATKYLARKNDGSGQGKISPGVDEDVSGVS